MKAKVLLYWASPLNNPNTNQKLYQIDKFKYNIIGFKDITSKFWNNV